MLRGRCRKKYFFILRFARVRTLNKAITAYPTTHLWAIRAPPKLFTYKAPPKLFACRVAAKRLPRGSCRKKYIFMFRLVRVRILNKATTVYAATHLWAIRAPSKLFTCKALPKLFACRVVARRLLFSCCVLFDPESLIKLPQPTLPLIFELLGHFQNYLLAELLPEDWWGEVAERNIFSCFLLFEAFERGVEPQDLVK